MFVAEKDTVILRKFIAMTRTKIDTFKELAPIVFQCLVDDYGYSLTETKVNMQQERDWSVHLTYINLEKNLKIIVKQEPYYTDYGFSFFIYNMIDGDYNILYTVTPEKQDVKNDFLIKSCSDLFSTKETLDLISGISWTQLGRIPFQIM